MKNSREFLKNNGLPGSDPPEGPASRKRFPDDGQYRVEIPSTEGPRALAAVLDEAEKRKVPVHRVSQGSGIMLLTDEEITEMLELGRNAAIEVNLFVGPRATFGFVVSMRARISIDARIWGSTSDTVLPPAVAW